MTITNGYATLVQFKNRLNSLGTATDATDDGVIENIIEQASRAIDMFCGRTFYARTETRYFNWPPKRELRLDDDLISISTLTNGDGVVISSAYYHFIPKNSPPYYAVRLKEYSSINWQLSATNGYEFAISVAGSWGFVDRAATDAYSVGVIRATEEACILIAMNEYRRLSGENVSGTSIITGAGVIIAPQGIPTKAADIIGVYVKRFR